MNVSLAKAHGAPCPTAVLDGRAFSESEPELLSALADLRADLRGQGAGDVLKNAIVRPSRHPLFDLDYRFVQSLPHSHDSFDLRGSCGHSILAAVEAAARTGMIQPLVPGCRVRVNVLNNGDNVVCETEKTSDRGTRFTAHFLCSPPLRPPELLMTGEPVTDVPFEDRSVPVSLVSMGNPYAFVDASHLGVSGPDALFGDDPRLFTAMTRLRVAVCESQGWDTFGAFPKIAALLPQEGGGLFVRAVSVPSWHPTVALTGAICLGAAAGIAGTVPWSLAGRTARNPDTLLTVRTPGGCVRVAAHSTQDPDHVRRLAWVSVAEKQVEYRGLLRRSRTPAAQPGSAAGPRIPVLATSAHRSEEAPWVPLTA
ncbi:PrpF domain-containing protein [Streptomyces sp. 549]|uniref:PrpF domain-containing protein n=1 Tax=Streptomyces sp. 549 TaxID=3049076 RepID=UPI0024C216F7|nr:PrpF domain-containing protein [Streptomyces sp. 549]MDK1475900.1 PrpF domain-containing protein [Streptomyces sp. 549]